MSSRGASKHGKMMVISELKHFIPVKDLAELIYQYYREMYIIYCGKPGLGLFKLIHYGDESKVEEEQLLKFDRTVDNLCRGDDDHILIESCPYQDTIPGQKRSICFTRNKTVLKYHIPTSTMTKLAVDKNEYISFMILNGGVGLDIITVRGGIRRYDINNDKELTATQAPRINFQTLVGGGYEGFTAVLTNKRGIWGFGQDERDSSYRSIYYDYQTKRHNTFIDPPEKVYYAAELSEKSILLVCETGFYTFKISGPLCYKHLAHKLPCHLEDADFIYLKDRLYAIKRCNDVQDSQMWYLNRPFLKNEWIGVACPGDIHMAC